MAVTINKENKEKKLLEVSITNGDSEKLHEILEKWNFKDMQSLMRYMSSVMILTHDCDIWIKNDNGIPEQVKPSEHLLR